MSADVGEQRRTGSVQITLVLPWGRVTVLRTVAVLIAGGQLAWYTIELLRGFFFQDDFVLLYLGGTVPLNELLLRDYNGHLQPGAFVVSWLVSHAAGLSWPAAIVPVVAMQVAVAVLAWRTLLALFGPQWAILVPYTVIVFSPLAFGLSFWWAYALQLLPVQVAVLGAVNAFVAARERPTIWRTAQVLLFTAFGLAFWEKAALVPIVVVGVALALSSGGVRERVVSVARRHAALWVSGVVLLAAYVLVHAATAPVAADSYVPTVGEFATQTREQVGDGLAPALFGGPWSGEWVGFRSLAPQDTWVLVISWTLLGLVVLLGLWIGRARAVWAWLTLLAYLLASVASIAFSRLGGDWGAIIGTDPRYIADALPVAALAAALALLRPRDAVTDAAAVPDRAAPFAALRRPAAAAVVALGLCAIYIAGAVVSIAGALPEQRHGLARDYVENVRAAHRLEPDLVLYDTEVPPDLLLALLGDKAMASRALDGLRLRVDQPTHDLRILDSAGIPREIVLMNQIHGGQGPVADCGHLLGQRTARVGMEKQVDGQRRVLKIGYFAQTGFDGRLATPDQRFDVTFEAGAHHLYVVADGGFRELLLEADGAVCITDVVVGEPLPRLG